KLGRSLQFCDLHRVCQAVVWLGFLMLPCVPTLLFRPLRLYLMDRRAPCRLRYQLVQAHVGATDVAPAAERVLGYFSDVPMRRLPRLRPPWSNVSIVRWFGAQEDFVSRLNPVSRLVLYRMHVPKPRCGHSVG